MAESSKLVSINRMEEKIQVSDHLNRFHFTADKRSDSFVIDMESFPSGSGGDSDPIINLQRSLSRKGCQRGSEKQGNEDKDSSLVASSPRGNYTPEKPKTVGLIGTIDHGTSSPLLHHQIAITAGNISTVPDSHGRSFLRRNSFKRSSPWVFDPRKLVFIFATLSSMGTILLIYLTLSVSKYTADEIGLDWQQ